MVILKRTPIAIRSSQQHMHVREMVRDLNEYTMESNIDMLDHIKIVNGKIQKLYLRDI